jgi:hypothetical protein
MASDKSFVFRLKKLNVQNIRDKTKDWLMFSYQVSFGDTVVNRYGHYAFVHSGDSLPFSPKPENMPAYDNPQEAWPEYPWEIPITLPSDFTGIIHATFVAFNRRGADPDKIPALLTKIAAAAASAAATVLVPSGPLTPAAVTALWNAVIGAVGAILGEGGGDWVDHAFNEPKCIGPVYIYAGEWTLPQLLQQTDSPDEKTVRSESHPLVEEWIHWLPSEMPDAGYQELIDNQPEECGHPPHATLEHEVGRLEALEFGPVLGTVHGVLRPMTGGRPHDWVGFWGDAESEVGSKVTCAIHTHAGSTAQPLNATIREHPPQGSHPFSPPTHAFSISPASAPAFMGNRLPSGGLIFHGPPPPVLAPPGPSDTGTLPNQVLLNLYGEFAPNGNLIRHRVRYRRGEIDVMLQPAQETPH